MTRRHWIHEAGRQGNRRFCDALVLLCSVVHVNRFSKEVSITIEKIFQLAGYHLLKKNFFALSYNITALHPKRKSKYDLPRVIYRSEKMHAKCDNVDNLRFNACVFEQTMIFIPLVRPLGMRPH